MASIRNMEKAEIFDVVDEYEPKLTELGHHIWATPELSLYETESSERIQTFLDAEAFNINTGTGEIDTAFIAEYGSGEPTIGILGEYDALPGLSQEVASERKPVHEDAPGHGCGHNLLGTGGVGAVVAIKEAIRDGSLSGTIRYYGCPAEEILAGKVFMARDGAFDDLDAAFIWHPNDLTYPKRGSALALNSLKFQFKGVSAHASASPSTGRSALDAVQLMNTGVEYLREHVSDSISIHYVITEGGEAPNVVPAEAEVWYYIRTPIEAWWSE